MKKKAMRYFFGFIALLMGILVFLVWFVDPFYQYHAPFFGVPAVLYDREMQTPGSLRNLPYDSCLIGSSVVENCDSTLLDEAFSCHTIKIVKGTGSAPDLLYYLNMAHENRELSYVFYNLDLFSLMGTTEVTVVSQYTPKYLFTETFLDDFAYFFNKDVLLKKIPLTLMYSLQGKYTGGNAYNWSEGKVFSVSQAMKAYEGPKPFASPADFTEEKQIISENIKKLTEEVAGHPDTHYIFFFPPYSLLYWDEVVRAGEKEKYEFALKEALDGLFSYDNVRIYSFQTDYAIIGDLNFYMDKVHFATQINRYMIQCIIDENARYLITDENKDDFLRMFSETCDYIAQEGIYMYYERE